MRLNLERVDASGLHLDLSSDLSGERQIALDTVEGLRGMLSQSAQSLAITNGMAELVSVSLLRLKFQTFAINLLEPGRLEQLSGNYERRPGSTDLSLFATNLTAPRLALKFETFHIEGDLLADGVKLRISTSQRFVQAERLELKNVRMSGVFPGEAPRLVATNVKVTWGDGGYRVEIGALELPKATVGFKNSDRPDSRSEDGEALRIGGASPTAGETAQVPGSGINWSVLDGLSGPLDVDVFVDMKVPVLGTRRAKHPFRISIKSGTLNYLDLERDLSALEDALIDFAVRDGDLVLERGIPLWPTRGRGKPILIWPLHAEDFALTAENRVRLSVLPRARLATPEEPTRTASALEAESSTQNGGSAVALRELNFVNLQSLLRLDPVKTSKGPLRELSFEELMLHGSVYYARDSAKARDGELLGKLRALAGSIEHLPLGESHLDVGSLRLGELANLSFQFQGIHLSKVSFELSELHLSSLVLGNLNV